MWAVLALGAATLTSFNPILYKRMLRDTDAIVVVWGVTLLALPLLGFLNIILASSIPTLNWLFLLGVLGSAGLNAIAHLASTRALQLEDVSLVTPLLVFSPVFTLLISAIFLGEIPSTRGLLGVMMILIGAYWLTRQSGANWLTPFKSLTLKPGIALVLLAGLLWAVTPLFEKMAIQNTAPESPRFAAFVITALLTAILTPAVVRRGRPAMTQLVGHRRELLLAALIAGTAPVLGYTALSLGLVGYVTTLFKLSTLMTVLWGSLFLNEKELVQRLPASLVMVLGAVLIAI
ncbi:MAG: DMT family transporter [Anaerolineales bacterium]|nr:DMT family transporter [Anaerolineales bacterium]